MRPLLIIHGGAGRTLREPERGPIVRAALHEICATVYAALESGATAMEVVELGCCLLEDDVNFNAGTGSVLQSDGQIRMTAAIMDGSRQAFSGVVNAQRVQNPIKMARRLSDFPDRVVASEGAALLAREMALPIYDPATDKRLKEWLDERSRGFTSDPCDLVAQGREGCDHRTGTIGVVARDARGQLAAGTSTGGRGFERIGRVSDTGMPAGNYATNFAGISCTGIGEDIIDEGMAVRVAVRVEDGLSLLESVERSIAGCVARQRMLGLIAISARGEMVWGKASDLLLACWHDGTTIGDCVGAQAGPMTQALRASD